MAIQFTSDHAIPATDLVKLYDSVGWTAYTDHPEILQAAVSASLAVVSAWDGDELIGLARVVGDGLTMVYLQDVLVDPRWHRQGIGQELFARVMEPYADVRQKFLITDGSEQQRSFYASLEFTPLQEMNPPLMAYGKLA